jgi:hypothetical protein
MTWKTIWLTAPLFIVGCSTPKPTEPEPTTEPSAAYTEPAFLNPVPAEVVQQAKQRLSGLHEGMNIDQVLTALGLIQYKRNMIASGGGSAGNSWLHFHLRQGCALALRLGEKGEVKSAAIEEAHWPESKTN